MSQNGHKKLRLVKVIVQPVFVVDDGETLTEQQAQPTPVPATEWASYPARLAQDIKDTEAELNRRDE